MAEEKFKLQSSKKKKTEKEKRKKEEGESYGDEKSSLRPPATHISIFVYVLLEVVMDFSLC
jgi:hypothetical protein